MNLLRDGKRRKSLIMINASLPFFSLSVEQAETYIKGWISDVLKATPPMVVDLQLPDKIDLAECMHITGKGKSWIYKHCMDTAEDPLTHEKFGKQLIFSRKSIRQFMDDRTIVKKSIKETAAEELAAVVS